MKINRDNIKIYYDFENCFKTKLDEKVCSFIMLKQGLGDFKIHKKHFLKTLGYTNGDENEFIKNNFGKEGLWLFKMVQMK